MGEDTRLGVLLSNAPLLLLLTTRTQGAKHKHDVLVHGKKKNIECESKQFWVMVCLQDGSRLYTLVVAHTAHARTRRCVGLRPGRKKEEEKAVHLLKLT